MDHFVQLAGIGWNPGIRGVLDVLVGVVVLFGSVYLILGTNLGSRLGFLVITGAFFGWMTILGFTWFMTPPAIGPRGQLPKWEVVDVVYGDPTNSNVAVVHDLPNTCWSSKSASCDSYDGTGTLSAQMLTQNPAVTKDAGKNPTVSQILAVTPHAADGVDFGGWTPVSAADAGEQQAASDAALVADKIFGSNTEYVVLDTFQLGGKEPLKENPNRLDRITHKIKNVFQRKNPTHYAVVQIQPVIPQATVAGQAPPTPKADPNAKTINVVMVRNLGDLRLPAGLVTLGSGLMLGVIAYALHRRDKLAYAHIAAAKD
jgi:hypothetical protein